MPYIKAVLCGKGTERHRLELMIADAGLQYSILLMGEKPHNEVLQLMQRSKIFLHPSSYEGFSGACLEALYAGAHVISFCNPKRCSGIKKHWHIAEDTESMTGLILELLQSPDTDYTPVLPYTMKETARAVMELFIR